jgi:hypothetical protein
MMNRIIAVIVICLGLFMAILISTTFSYCNIQSVELRVDTTILGREDILKVTLIIDNSEFVHINDDSLLSYFKLIGEPDYTVNNETGKLIINYKLKPKSIGEFTLQNIKVFLKNGDIIYPEEITINVVEGSIYQIDDEDANQEIDLPLEKRTFIKTLTDKETYYKGETIILSTYLYSIYPIENNYEYYNGRPSLSKDFWEPGYLDYEVVLSQTITTEQNGIEYEKKLIDRRVLFPKFTGRYTFESYKWKVPFGEKIRHYDRYILQTEPITISVKPLPIDNIPNDFSGVVGSYNLETKLSGYAYQEREGIPVFTGETFIKYTLILTGRGNPDLTSEPSIVFPDDTYEIISVNIIPRSHFKDDGYRLTKTFEYLIRPLKAGLIKLPKAVYSFFNPVKEQYQLITTDSIKINIQQEISGQQGSEDDSIQTALEKLRPIQDKTNLTNKPPYMIIGKNNIILLLYTIFVLLLIPVSLVIYKHKKHIIDNPDKIRQQNAYKNAISSFNQISVKKGDSVKSIYKHINKAMYKYFSDRFNINEGKANINTLVNILNKINILNEIIESVKEYHEYISYKIYAGSPEVKTDEIKNDMKRLKKIISNIENNIK